MKVIYTRVTPFGKFFYDPLSHKGVAIPDAKTGIMPVIIGMKNSYNPYDEPEYKEFDIEPKVFDALLDAGEKRDRTEAISIYLQYFSRI
ncbi:MAG TPA: hypothetical protein VJB11_03235 [archaeon]|nr:hypothetical protein [archaeon]